MKIRPSGRINGSSSNSICVLSDPLSVVGRQGREGGGGRGEEGWGEGSRHQPGASLGVVGLAVAHHISLDLHLQLGPVVLF